MTCGNCLHFQTAERKLSWGHGDIVFECPQSKMIRAKKEDARTCPYFMKALALDDDDDEDEQ